MEPNEVAKAYLSQAKALENFLSKLENEDYTNTELLLIIKIIGEKYYELLINLAKFTPMLSAHKVKFYKIFELDSKMNLDEPPFEKDFFSKKLD